MEIQSRRWAGFLRRLPAGLFFGAAAVLLTAGLYLRFKPVEPNAYELICKLVSERIYLNEKELGDWPIRCLQHARNAYGVHPLEIAQDARNLFAELRISHLDLYDAEESRRIWAGEDLETGIESEFVDGFLVVFEVLPGSAGAAAGLQRGDVILSIQNNHPAPAIARSVGGTYQIQRKKKTFEVEITPREFARDEQVQVRDMKSAVVVRVPSFRADFFDKKVWLEKIALIKKLNRTVVVDLRGNPGGNFVAGLRFLSPFMCGAQEIGYLTRPASRLGAEADLKDDLNDDVQIRTIVGNDLVYLKTYDDYDCLATPVRVLTDSRTSSTAEMVAQALRDYLGAPLLGVSTSGQLLVGVWHPLPELGPGWRLSIPEAVFQSKRGQRIEGQGVKVDRELYYALPTMQEGRDTWIEAGVSN